MRVLVTGAAGYVGMHVAWALLKAGHDVVALDDLSCGHRRALLHLGVPWVEADLRSRSQLRAAVTPAFDACVHLAARSLVPDCESRPEEAWEVNASGSLNLFDACRAAGVRRIVATSSAAVYGTPARHLEQIPEDALRRPVSVYGRTKSAMEDALHDLCEAHELSTVALRVFNVVGADESLGLGEHHEPETHLAPRLLDMAAAGGGEVEVYGGEYGTQDGSAVRDYVSVTDVTRAHLLALLRTAERPGHEAFNVGTGVGTSVMEVVARVEAVTGVSLTRLTRPARRGDPDALVADPRLASEVLGFRAEVPLRDSLRDAWAWHSRDLLREAPERGPAGSQEPRSGSG